MIMPMVISDMVLKKLITDSKKQKYIHRIGWCLIEEYIDKVTLPTLSIGDLRSSGRGLAVLVRFRGDDALRRCSEETVNYDYYNFLEETFNGYMTSD